MEEAPDLLLEELRDAVEDLMLDRSKAQLAQCARVLATYVALYKHHFGELSVAQYEGLGEDPGGSLDFSESVYLNGLRELLETLSLLEEQGEVQESQARLMKSVH